VVYSVREALALEPDLALITNPASLHVKTAMELAERSIHLFIEKPLSVTLQGVDDLLDLCARRSVVVAVGYNLRFHRPIQVLREAIDGGGIGRPLLIRAEVGQYLPDWRQGTDYRKGVTAQRKLGGGVLLELSHELDYVRWLMGDVQSVSAHMERLSDLEVDVEDAADVFLSFASGAAGSVHLDMIDRAATRSCRVVGTEGTLAWSDEDRGVRLFTSTRRRWESLCSCSEAEPNAMYVAELKHFLNCVRGTETPLVGGQDGRRVLEIVLAARQSAQHGRTVGL
jgi:predicted dehydrogenase